MVQGLESDLKQTRPALPAPSARRKFASIEQAIAEDFSAVPRPARRGGEVEDGGDQSPAAAVRLGVCYYLLGRYHVAAETLKTGDGGALANFYLGKTNVALGQLRRGPAKLRRRRQGRLQRRRLRAWPGPRPLRLRRRLPRRAWCCSTTCRAPSSKRPNTSTSARPACRPSAATRTKSWRCSSGRSRPIATMPARCSAWPWKTIAAATTKRPSICTSAPAHQFPSHVGPLLNLGILYEDRQQYDRAQQCYQRILDVISEQLPSPAVPERRPSLGRHVLRRRRPAQAATA